MISPVHSGEERHSWPWGLIPSALPQGTNHHHWDLKAPAISLAVMESGIGEKSDELGLTAERVYGTYTATAAKVRGEKNFPEVACHLGTCYNNNILWYKVRKSVVKISLDYMQGFQWIFFKLWGGWEGGLSVFRLDNVTWTKGLIWSGSLLLNSFFPYCPFWMDTDLILLHLYFSLIFFFYLLLEGFILWQIFLNKKNLGCNLIRDQQNNSHFG